MASRAARRFGLLIEAVRLRGWSQSRVVRKAVQADDWRGSFETASCGRAGLSRRRLFSPLLRPAPERRRLAHSLTSAGRGGEVLGRFGDCAAARGGEYDTIAAGAGARRLGRLGVVGIAGGMRFGDRSPRARGFA